MTGVPCDPANNVLHSDDLLLTYEARARELSSVRTRVENASSIRMVIDSNHLKRGAQPTAGVRRSGSSASTVTRPTNRFPHFIPGALVPKLNVPLLSVIAFVSLLVQLSVFEIELSEFNVLHYSSLNVATFVQQLNCTLEMDNGNALSLLLQR